MHSLPHWNVGSEFALLGIVDLDAIPEDKRDLPLGDDDNPIPLVEFTSISQEKPPRSPSQQSKATASAERELRGTLRGRLAEYRVRHRPGVSRQSRVN